VPDTGFNAINRNTFTWRTTVKRPSQ